MVSLKTFFNQLIFGLLRDDLRVERLRVVVRWPVLYGRPEPFLPLLIGPARTLSTLFLLDSSREQSSGHQPHHRGLFIRSELEILLQNRVCDELYKTAVTMSEMVCKEESASEDETEELIIKNESHQHIFAENEEFHVNNANTDNVTIIETPFSDVDDKTKGSGKGFALGSISEKIVPWLQSRYEMKEGGKTAIQEIITLYNHDFPRDCVYFPLESFQVGQLVRQAFPEIALCKVTCKESKKRYRCYKGLTRREADCGPAPIFPYELPKVQKRKSKPASQNSPNVIYMQVTALQDARSETPPGIRGQIATCKIKLPQSTRPSSSRPFPQLRVQPPKPDLLNLLSSASTSPNSSMHSPLIESAPTGQGQHNPYFVPFIKPHSEQNEKAQESPPKKTCKLELVPISSENSAESISSHQQEMLSELPTMVAAVPSSSATKRKLEIGKLHVTQSLDYIERQAYAQEDFQEIEDFILERLDQIRSKQFGL